MVIFQIIDCYDCLKFFLRQLDSKVLAYDHIKQKRVEIAFKSKLIDHLVFV